MLLTKAPPTLPSLKPTSAEAEPPKKYCASPTSTPPPVPWGVQGRGRKEKAKLVTWGEYTCPAYLQTRVSQSVGGH